MDKVKGDTIGREVNRWYWVADCERCGKRRYVQVGSKVPQLCAPCHRATRKGEFIINPIKYLERRQND